MSGFLEPNIHPVLVHFAYALSLSALFVYLLGLFFPSGPRRDGTRVAGDWMLTFGAIAIVGTIAAGFYAYYTVAHDGPSHAAMTTHRNWAVPSGIAILILSIWRYVKRAKAPSVLFLGLLATAALSLSVTAWWGGNIVYKYGLGVQSLPAVTGDGHDHDHGEPPQTEEANIAFDKEAHDNSDGHHDVNDSSVENEHDNSDGHHEADTKPPIHALAPPGTPAAISDQFRQALKEGNLDELKSLFLPNVIIAEGGGAERSLKEYADHHMKSDIAFAASLTSRKIQRDVLESGDMATVITQSEMVGSYEGAKVHNRMMETMTMRREDEGWKIAHVHWSSSPISESDNKMLEPDKVPEGHDNSDGHHDPQSGN